MTGFKYYLLTLSFAGFFAACQCTIPFYVYTKDNRDGQKIILGSKVDLDVKNNITVIIHGLNEQQDVEIYVDMRMALFDRGENVTIIMPDYFLLSETYTISYTIVAQSVASFLKKNKVNPNITTVIGHSLGAQIAGILKNYGFKPSIIYGLDPAGPLFNSSPEDMKLSVNSANVVEALHTDVGRLGTTTLDSHKDVYVNYIPCCETDICKHQTSCTFFTDTIRNGPMKGNSCTSQKNALLSNCTGAEIYAGYGSKIRTDGERVIANVFLTKCLPGNLV